MAKRSSSKKASKSKQSSQKNSLVANINKRRKSHTSRSKKNSTVTKEDYDQMQAGWPKKKAAKSAKSGGTTKAKKKNSPASGSATKKKSTGSTKKRRATKKAKRSGGQTKDPNGGLTAAGRRAFNEKEGSHLKPGVRGPADTPEKMKRKGSFLRRHFATLRGPLIDNEGQPTRLALQARAWGEPVPKTTKAAKKLADKGTRLLERYKRTKAANAST